MYQPKPNINAPASLAQILGTATTSGKREKHNVHPADVYELERSCQMQDDVLEFSQ